MQTSLRDRLAALSRRELAGLVALVLVGLSAVGLWYARSIPRPVELHTTSAAAAPGTGGGVAPTASLSPSPDVVVVNVAGWVVHPGVYEFHEGDRVIDALKAAGGAKKGAALDALNLAALLVDAQQILVPKLGEGGAIVGVPGVVSSGSAAGTGTLVNVNTATETDLEDLPGIGPVLAQRIIDYRTEHGPFPTVDALDDVSGIGPATLDDLRDLVTV